jgi:hypothetical protein
LAKSRFVLHKTISVFAAVEQTIGKIGSRIWKKIYSLVMSFGLFLARFSSKMAVARFLLNSNRKKDIDSLSFVI